MIRRESKQEQGNEGVLGPEQARLRRIDPVSADAEPPEIATLDLGRSRRFLRRLEDNPFIALVVDEDDQVVHVYRKGITPESIQAMREYLDEMEQEMRD